LHALEVAQLRAALLLQRRVLHQAGQAVQHGAAAGALACGAAAGRSGGQGGCEALAAEAVFEAPRLASSRSAVLTARIIERMVEAGFLPRDQPGNAGPATTPSPHPNTPPPQAP
jgi:hypothetical protein